MASVRRDSKGLPIDERGWPIMEVVDYDPVEARARNTAFREILEVCEHGSLNLVKGYIQAQLGMTKPLEQVRREIGEQASHAIGQKDGE